MNGGAVHSQTWQLAPVILRLFRVESTPEWYATCSRGRAQVCAALVPRHTAHVCGLWTLEGNEDGIERTKL